MRLLLFLSALLTALSGVTGARAVAQPVQASAAAAMAVPQAVAVSRATLRFSAPSYATVPPRHLPTSRPVSTIASRALYAERRRE